MKTVYIDPNTFCCYPTQDEGSTRIPYETDFFDGKCDSYILGFRVVFKTDQTMITAWKDYNELDAAEREYERQKLADAENALAILLGGEST